MSLKHVRFPGGDPKPGTYYRVTAVWPDEPDYVIMEPLSKEEAIRLLLDDVLPHNPDPQVKGANT